MKREFITKYISYFVLAVLIIAVYKTFDSLGVIWGYISSFLKLLLPIFFAFAIAFLLFPLCNKLEGTFKSSKIKFVASHRRGFAIATVYLAALALVTGFFWIILPMVFKSVSDLIAHLPSIVKSVMHFLNNFEFAGFSLRKFMEDITIYDVMATFNFDNVQNVVASLAGLSKGIINIFLSVIISVYILADRTGLLSTANKLMSMTLPEEKKSVFLKYLRRTFNIMYKYLYCQLLDGIIVFGIAFIALSVMKVQYAPVLAMFIGVMNLVPYFGATIACTLAALLTVFTASFSKGVLVAVVLIVLQQLDANLIQPRLVRDSLEVKPFWVLCGVLVGGGLFGMIGVLLAVPIMALIKTIFEDICDYKAEHFEQKKQNAKETQQ